jgi:hypothetical protein
MPDSPNLKFGILKARDLVELYYGARMVANLIENVIGSPTASAPILGPDPRRIKYEIILANQSATVGDVVFLASVGGADTPNPQAYAVPPAGTIIVKRDFFTDLDAVTAAIFGLEQNGTVLITTRETYLTPVPIDELP